MDTEMAEMEAQNHALGGRISPAAIFNKVNLPVTLKFEDLVYKIKIEKAGFFTKPHKPEEKVILKGITGHVLPGEMLALLGPSGSGKTTLLTALGGRLRGHLTGTVTYNTKPFTNAMNRNTGFVTQDDVLYPHLTVTETLLYTAFLRLPRTSSRTEKARHADAVLTQLGLERCRDTIVGWPFLRGVSGGERKRVSIGQEMLINPSLLFLDEPTSGLDSTTARKIVSTLADLASGGRTIVMAIHQPSSRLFYMFQKVLLLSEGNPLYFGTGSGVMDYFSGIGFAPSVAMNPADFILDLANGVWTADTHEDEAAIKQTLVSAYKTHLLEIVKSELGNENMLHFSENDNKFKRWSNSWWEQFSVLFVRGIKERKHESFSILNIAEILIVSIVAGLLWWKSSINRLQDQVGIFFFYSTFWGFNPLYQAIFTFPEERTMFEKERSSGMYRLSSYFMALSLADLPMVLTLPTVFYTISYWMAGLKPTPVSFFSGLFVLLYSVLCTQGLGLAIGALVMDIKKAVTLASVIMMTSILAGGYYVQHVPVFIGWIKYLSISQYTYKLLLLSQYQPGETYPCERDKACLVEDFPAIKNVGLNGIAVSVIALTVMMVGYRLVAYVALMRFGVAMR